MNTQKTMNKKFKLLIIGIAIIFISLWIVSSIFLPRGGDEKVTVKIPRGSSAGKIGQILHDDGIIRSAFGFKLMVKLARKGADLKPGAYILTPSMSPSEVMAKIVKGETSSKWLTIPEGYTIRQIADKIEEEGFGKSGKFYALAKFNGKSFKTSFPNPGNSLEGYLFPDTYLFPTGISEKDIINEMLDCFATKVYDPLKKDILSSDMNLHDIITLASLIEREARVAKDRPLISEV